MPDPLRWLEAAKIHDPTDGSLKGREYDATKVKYQLGHVGKSVLALSPLVHAGEFHYQVVDVKNTSHDEEDYDAAQRILAMKIVMTGHLLFVIRRR